MKPIRLTVGRYLEGKLVSAGEYTPGTSSFDNIKEYLDEVKAAIFAGTVRGTVYATDNRIETGETNGSEGWVYVEEFA